MSIYVVDEKDKLRPNVFNVDNVYMQELNDFTGTFTAKSSTFDDLSFLQGRISITNCSIGRLVVDDCYGPMRIENSTIKSIERLYLGSGSISWIKNCRIGEIKDMAVFVESDLLMEDVTIDRIGVEGLSVVGGMLLENVLVRSVANHSIVFGISTSKRKFTNVTIEKGGHDIFQNDMLESLDIHNVTIDSKAQSKTAFDDLEIGRDFNSLAVNSLAGFQMALPNVDESISSGHASLVIAVVSIILAVAVFIGVVLTIR